MMSSNMPEKFVLFDKQFVWDGVFSWFGNFTEQNIIVNIIETDESEVYELGSVDKATFICTIYHFDEVIDTGFGKTPMQAATNAKLYFYLTGIDDIKQSLKDIFTIKQ